MALAKLATERLFSEFLPQIGWSEEQESYFSRFSEAFSARTGFFARAYLMGLLLPGERKSVEPMAARLGVDYDPLHRLVNDAPWDDRHVLAPLRRMVASWAARAADRFAIFDDTGFPKQGKHSVGVQRQYSGTLGKTGNCQIAVAMAYGWGDAAQNEAVPVGWRLYLPESWLSNPERREKSGIPATHAPRTKWQLGLELLDESRADGMELDFVLADCGYGDAREFRAALRARRLAYVVGINPSHFRVLDADVAVIPTGRGRLRVCEPQEAQDVAVLLKGLPEAKWQRVEWRPGLSAEFHRRSVRLMLSGSPNDEVCELVLERRANGELKAHLAWGMESLNLTDLIERLHRRWLIEQIFQQAKEELGLDHFEGRSYQGWNHHATLVTAAFLLLAERRRGSPPFQACPRSGVA